MIINYIKSDLLETPQKYIAHGVNCQGVMGSGVALNIKNKWPNVYEKYIEGVEVLWPKKNHLLLGLIQEVSIPKQNKIIVNMFTQEFYGREENIRYVSYDALADCFKNLVVLLNSRDEDRDAGIAIPKIGAGLGNGNWDIIEKIIDVESKHWPVYVYEL